MIFVFIALWTIAAVLLINDPKTKSTRWAALTAFAGGGGGLSRTITENVLPYMHKYDLSTPTIDQILLTIQKIGSFMNHSGTPYCFLMYGLTVSQLIPAKRVKILSYLLAIPIIPSILVSKWSPVLVPNFKFLFFWCVPYFLISIGIITYSFIKEKNPIIRQEKIFTVTVVFPLIIFQILVNYTLKAFFYNDHAWRFMPVMIAFVFTGFIVLGTKYGSLGIKLRFERQSLGRTMTSLVSGTSILNHTLKNELLKISLFSDNIRNLTKKHEGIDLDQHLLGLDHSVEHLKEMVMRIHGHTQEIVLQEIEEHLNILVNECSEQFVLSNCTAANNIRINVDIPEDIYLVCDRVHLVEILNNLIRNAIESMKNVGEIKIYTLTGKKNFSIYVQDSGSGIPKDKIHLVLHPFYSTKKTGKNFGLGLSYCFNVMQKIRGNLIVLSEVDKGTTIILDFPKSKMVIGKASTMIGG
ncbi:HAMP domain-containing histidine kinase [Paenibacillus alkaliterrae]|uniref:sensor histidine kinase n=1 Tax=Paenibacillus alkaliterrae TaxID=320909 RepID=UPI001F395CD3|nr:HAMP domain-containing sensor histidine kinase [Paenibacillus alkaliterrae]MCF2940616.1 HAMP domain-containing histidine kinase [Paenibacillus alkaliterrae]